MTSIERAWKSRVSIIKKFYFIFFFIGYTIKKIIIKKEKNYERVREHLWIACFSYECISHTVYARTTSQLSRPGRVTTIINTTSIDRMARFCFYDGALTKRRRSVFSVTKKRKTFSSRGVFLFSFFCIFRRKIALYDV